MEGVQINFFPATVDPISGYLYAVYYDRRGTEKDNETNTYLSKSEDGGQTWAEQQINEDFFFLRAPLSWETTIT